MNITLSTMILAPALLWTMWSDLLYRRIANWLVLMLLTLWACCTGYAIGQAGWLSVAPAVTTGMLAAATVLVAGFGLFAIGWVGAGDVKMMSVLCLWMGANAFVFIVVASLAGGILALGLPVLRTLETLLAQGVIRLPRRLRGPAAPLPTALRAEPVSGVPYGVVLAFAASTVLYLHF
ncbi:hypothetical protein ASB57_08135 [Bordetella sp. N]|nr:hypothetical protein ASB57_08135 [Bordetella sp. N]